MKYGLIGEHLGHSFSKEVHAALASYEYEIKEIAREELSSFMINKAFNAINVTIPYKEAVIPFIDEISEEARLIGAVNTIVNKDGRLYGYNTDFLGMRSLFKRLGIAANGKKIAILGSGGTAKTAYAVSKSLGATEILVVSRQKKDGAIDYDELYENHANTDIIINTTPVGMYPNNADSPIDISRFDNLTGVIDAIYNPLRTSLVLDAKRKGIPAEGGLYMLIAQAVYASEIFLDSNYHESKIDEIYNSISSDKENIALIGMPSSGKSTVGKILADMLGREIVETDDIIVRNAGKCIKDIFTEDGEAKFRDIESSVIKQVAAQNGKIISTGGGSILRSENLHALQQNSKIVFIDRSLKNLISSDDRPLSKDMNAVKALYESRYDKYKSAADIIVNGDNTPETVAQEIIGGLKE